MCTSLYKCDTSGHNFLRGRIEPNRLDMSHSKLTLRQDAYSQRDLIFFISVLINMYLCITLTKHIAKLSIVSQNDDFY